MGVGARVKTLVTDGDVKQKKLAQKIGISESKLSHYLNERYQMPVHVLAALAEYFDVSADYLLELTDIPQRQPVLSEGERQLIERFRTLSKNQKELIVQNIRVMEEQNRR